MTDGREVAVWYKHYKHLHVCVCGEKDLGRCSRVALEMRMNGFAKWSAGLEGDRKEGGLRVRKQNCGYLLRVWIACMRMRRGTWYW